MDSEELLAQDRQTTGRSLSYKRRCLQSMIVGQTSVFYPDRADALRELDAAGAPGVAFLAVREVWREFEQTKERR